MNRVNMYICGIAVAASVSPFVSTTYLDRESPEVITIEEEVPVDDCLTMEVALDQNTDQFLEEQIQRRLDGSTKSPQGSTSKLADSLQYYSSNCFEDDNETFMSGSILPKS
jgi:hypothetical protein